MNHTEVITYARMHANRLREDIVRCGTREEHIRVSARANEADQIATLLENLAIT